MLQLVRDEPACQDQKRDVGLVFLNACVGRQVRQGPFGGSAKRNAEVKDRIVTERLTQTLTIFEDPKENIDHILIVGERGSFKYRSLALRGKLIASGVPPEKIIACGEAENTPKAVRLFLHAAVIQYGGRSLHVRIAMHQYWSGRVAHFLQTYRNYHQDEIPDIITFESHPIGGYEPNIWERMREIRRCDRRNRNYDFAQIINK